MVPPAARSSQKQSLGACLWQKPFIPVSFCEIDVGVRPRADGRGAVLEEPRWQSAKLPLAAHVRARSENHLQIQLLSQSEKVGQVAIRQFGTKVECPFHLPAQHNEMQIEACRRDMKWTNSNKAPKQGARCFSFFYRGAVYNSGVTCSCQFQGT